MSWFKVDDRFWSHPKVLALGDRALGAWVRAGSYCAGHATTMGRLSDVARKTLRITPKVAAELVASGLWDRVEDGYQFHDWQQYQPSKSQTPEYERGKKRRQREQMSRGHSGDDGIPTRPVPTRPKGDARDLCRKWAADTNLPLEALSSSHVQPAKAICSAAQAAGVAWAEVYARWVADPWVQAQAPGLTHLENNLHKYIKPTGEADPYANLPRYA